MLKSKTKLLFSIAGALALMAVAPVAQAQEAYKGWIQWHPQTGPNTISAAGTQFFPYKPGAKQMACEHGMDRMGKCIMGDADGDGVADNKDQCPETPIFMKVDGVGCSMDRDGDGLNNATDRCPDTKMGLAVDARGCALDDDRDGVIDGYDKCPGTSMYVDVNESGCKAEMDGDKDGVMDSADACLDTPTGLVVGSNGCWKLSGINFNTSSWALNPSAQTLLGNAAMTMKKHSQIRVEVQGHTDSRADASYNEMLSRKRSQAVIWFLTKQGVDRSRFVAVGFGEKKLMTRESNDNEMMMNRRVELHRIP
ncbi:OmpA family protein [Magnetococcus sp. PR-3]|uniref:OmpA family protein n=1 Tax=Magnetococcus sp. PR-3 TaxID=3120355 RepID=UPI002FCE3FAD